VVGGDKRVHLLSISGLNLECFGLNKIMSSGNCFCAEGYYEDGDTKNCLPCLRKCKSCINSYECQECRDGTGLG
jgi:hypothetical protein